MSAVARMPIWLNEEIHVNEFREALNNAGFHLHGDTEGRWVVDRVHAIALVRKDDEASA